jgi:hypothetical protein
MALVTILRSFSMLAPIAALPATLMIRSTALNHHQLATIFTPPILAMHGLNLYFFSDLGRNPLTVYFSAAFSLDHGSSSLERPEKRLQTHSSNLGPYQVKHEGPKGKSTSMGRRRIRNR